jgi:hypothetical protein
VAWTGHHRLERDRAAREGAAVQVVACPDGPKQLVCIAEAHRSGTQLEYPKGPLAALGREPGLTILLEPRSSEGIAVEVDEFLVKAKAELRTCAEEAIVSQNAPIQTGEVGINFTIAPNGSIEQTQTSFVFHKGRPIPDSDTPMAGPDVALARCMRKAVNTFPFKGADKPVRLSFSTKYVWRE